MILKVKLKNTKQRVAFYSHAFISEHEKTRNHASFNPIT